MKGQIKIEFVLGIIVFAVLIFYVSSQVGAAFSSVTTTTRLDMMKAKSVAVLEVLTKDSENGLATSTPNNLDVLKINAWENDDCIALQDFEMGEYRLTIYNSTDLMLQCGFIGLARLRTNVLRAVKIGNLNGNITLEMW